MRGRGGRCVLSPWPESQAALNTHTHTHRARPTVDALIADADVLKSGEEAREGEGEGGGNLQGTDGEGGNQQREVGVMGDSTGDAPLNCYASRRRPWPFALASPSPIAIARWCGVICYIFRGSLTFYAFRRSLR